MTRHAQSERLLLCDELERLGPDAPTLCEGWDTRDLAAHLVIREGRPDLAIGSFVPFFAGRLEREQRSMARDDYPALVARIRAGAPWWNPMSLGKIDELANLVEYFVHHEDIRRAQPGWTPRDLPEGLQEALWDSLRRMSRLLFRSAPTGVVLIAEGRGRHAAKAPGAHGTVVVRGLAAELVLFAYGRGRQATVELEGADEDVRLLREARLAL
ncbi:MAG: TIGR03085 family metal-binding protein [Micrococcales bacterium]|nr:TIGR03085 family metal-binding protein [Micrococcales bacterium]